jgi:hypothetical protein
VYCVDALLGATSYIWTLPAGITGSSTGNCITVNFGSTFNGGTICVRGNSLCGVGQQRCLNVPKLTLIPATPGNISGPSTLCPLNSSTYSVLAVANATEYEWVVSGGLFIVAGQGTNSVKIEAPAGFTSGSIKVRAKNCKGVSGFKILNIKGLPVTPVWDNDVATENPIVGVCGGSTHQFEVKQDINATCYTWTAPAGAVIRQHLTGAIGNPLTYQGNHDDVNITFPANFTSGFVTVTSCNACGTSSTTSLFVQSVPSAPAIINGPTSGLCGSSNVQYSVPAVTGATSYSWTVSSGITITSGAGTSSIRVRYTNSFSTGTICVRAKNKCGFSSYTCINVVGKPNAPSSITGHISVCKSHTNVLYTTPTIPGATSYLWTITGGGVITNGAGTKSIRVRFTSATSSTVNLSVRATTPCGTSPTTTITIAVNLNCKVAGEETEVVETASTISVFPNPTSGKTTMTINSVNDNNYSISVIDLIGNVILTESFAVTRGFNSKELDLGNVAKGIYFVTMRGVEEEIQTIRLIVD